MGSLALDVYLNAGFDTPTSLPHAGSSLEHPLVFDRVAREFKQMAEQGLIEIVDEHQAPAMGEMVIDRLVFRRLRRSTARP